MNRNKIVTLAKKDIAILFRYVFFDYLFLHHPCLELIHLIIEPFFF